MEKRLEAVLRKVLANPDVFVVANAELLGEPERPEVEVLPGVNVKKTPSTPAPMEMPTSLVKRIAVTVFVPQSMTQEKVDLARATSERMVGLKPERGDVLNVEKIGAPPAPAPRLNPYIDMFLQPRVVILAAWLLAACWGLLLLMRRFFDPFLGVLRDGVQHIQKALGERAAPTANEPAAAAFEALAPPEAAPRAAQDIDVRKHPFSFIQEHDMPALDLLLIEQTEQASAVIVQYLPPPLASRCLAAMTPAKREKVIANLSRSGLLDAGEVKKLEDAILAKIDYMMGGEEKLVTILDQAPISIQTSILSTLRQQDPELARRLDKRIVVIEDIGLLDEAGLAVLSRQASVRSMAVVLKSSAALREKVLPKFKSGLGEWLAQETTLMGELPEHIKEQEMRGVLQALVKLVKEGKIVLKKGTATPTASAAVPAAPPKAVKVSPNGGS